MFGLVDHSTPKDHLYAFIHHEGGGNKGGKNVASMACHHVINYIVPTIASKTTEELACDLMKGTRKGAKMLTSHMPVHVQSALQDNIVGCAVKDIHDPDDDTPHHPTKLSLQFL